MQEILRFSSEVSRLFEVKHLMLGMTTLLNPVQMPDIVSSNYGSLMKALVYLAQKSVEIRTKDNRQEQAEEDKDHGVICEDEDSDYDIELGDDSEDDEFWSLDADRDDEGCNYAKPLDSVDEVLHFANHLQQLQGSNADMYNFLMGQLDVTECSNFNQACEYAHQLASQ